MKKVVWLLFLGLSVAAFAGECSDCYNVPDDWSMDYPAIDRYFYDHLYNGSKVDSAGYFDTEGACEQARDSDEACQATPPAPAPAPIKTLLPFCRGCFTKKIGFGYTKYYYECTDANKTSIEPTGSFDTQDACLATMNKDGDCFSDEVWDSCHHG